MEAFRVNITMEAPEKAYMGTKVKVTGRLTNTGKFLAYRKVTMEVGGKTVLENKTLIKPGETKSFSCDFTVSKEGCVIEFNGVKKKIRGIKPVTTKTAKTTKTTPITVTTTTATMPETVNQTTTTTTVVPPTTTPVTTTIPSATPTVISDPKLVIPAGIIVAVMVILVVVYVARKGKIERPSD